MPTWGISGDYGFYRPNNSEVIEDTQQSLKDTFGNELNVGESSYADKLIKVQANREFKVWQQLEATYNAQTLNGAEGEFLDELHAYQGIPRNGATFGTGEAIVETNSDTNDIEQITTNTTFSTIGGSLFTVETNRTISDHVKGYKIEGDTLQAGSYTFHVTNSYNVETTATYALISNDDVDRLVFFNNLKTFFDSALPDDNTSVMINTTANKVSFYVGFTFSDNDYLFTGTEETFKLKFGSLHIGNRFSEHSVLSNETGYNPVASNNINSITPTPTGYVSVTNIESFFSGSDVETDAAYTVRALQQADAPHSGTRPAILSSLLAIDEVVGASLTKQVDLTTGLVTVEPVIFGGLTEDIAGVLYNTQPINNQYIGDISYLVATEDGKTETIQFSRGTDLKLSVRVEYKPLNGIPLSNAEQTEIQLSVEDVNSNIPVGGTVFNGQLSGAVFEVNPQRFTQLTLKIKLESEPDSSYSTVDYVPQPSELPRLSADRVEIIQVY